MADAEQPKKTYRGNCHCKRFVFEVVAPAPEQLEASSCNCSICTKKGAVWFRTNDEELKFVQGEEKDLAQYTFGSKNLVHKFCDRCGSSVMARSDSWNMVIVNLRMIQGPLNVWDMKRKPFDGKALGEPYKPAVYSGPEPTAGPDDAKIYHASCHCGAVRAAVRFQPIESLAGTGVMDSVVECNCSTCQRNASMWLKPGKGQVVVEGEENLTRYPHGLGMFAKTFCKTCGVQFSSEAVDLPADKVAALPPPAQNFHKMALALQPITLRVFDDFDISSIKTTKHNGAEVGASTYENP